VETFVLCFAAFVCGWLLCNVFLYQLVNRIDSQWRRKRQEEFAHEIAKRVVELTEDQRGAS
jgi:uncharacterized membrane protein YciS (DUF1049 family)